MCLKARADLSPARSPRSSRISILRSTPCRRSRNGSLRSRSEPRSAQSVDQPLRTKCILYGAPGGYCFLKRLYFRKLGQIHFEMIGPAGQREQISIRRSEMIAHEEFVTGELLLDECISLIQVGNLF